MYGQGLEVVGNEVDIVLRLHVAQSGECIGKRFAAKTQVTSRETEGETYIYNNVYDESFHCLPSFFSSDSTYNI